MQSRGHEDYISLSPSSKVRNQHRHEIGHDSYPASRRDAVDRSPRMQPPRVERRSLSPHNKIDGSRRILMREGRSLLTERRDYSWHLDARRAEKDCSGSPPFVPDHRKPHFDEGAVYRKYEYNDDIVYGDSRSNKLKHVYGYDHHSASSIMSKEKDYGENRILGIDRHVMIGHKSMPPNDGIMRGSHRVPLDFIPAPNYAKTGEHLQLQSRHKDIGQFDHEKLGDRDHISPDDASVAEFYKGGEKPMFCPRDDLYTMKPASHFKNFGSTHIKDFAGTSSGGSRSEFLSSYQEGIPASAAAEYPRNSVKLTEPIDFNTYGQRSVLDTRNIETSKRVMTSYPHGAYSPNRSDQDDYLYSKSQGLVNDDNDYPADELRRGMLLCYQVDHEQPLADYEYRELSRMSVMHPIVDKIDPAEDSYRNMRNSSTWEHNMHKQVGIDNLESGRILYASKHSGEYLGPDHAGVEFGRRDQHDGTSHLDVTQDHKISHLRSDYGFGRDAGPQFQKERLQDPAISVYDLDMQKLPLKRQRMEDELTKYEQSYKLLKRKYAKEENTNQRDPRTIIMSSKQYVPQEYEENGEEWIDDDLDALHPSRTQRFDNAVCRKAKRTYNAQDHHGDIASEEWLSSQDSSAHARKYPIRYYKPGVKYMKSYPRSGSLGWYNSHHNDKRSGIYRKQKTWKRTDEYEDEGAHDDDPSEDWVNVANSEPCQDSMEFKQLVHEAFLEFSKKLNLSSAVRRRYKEQGKAGSLFCIVCGRSSSKDFMDTQRLVTHAYMSHKVGLRARHLGLHKAICVLMGWNTYVPSDTTTWVPDVLPDIEAWAQKEDLVLWPPMIIIHNISMSNNNPEKQKVIPIEGIEAFLRGKGFVGGKIKVCLGKPADQSVILVKFLGTFTGLGNAERLNNYFLENKRGREEFEQKTSCSSKSSSLLEAGDQGERLEEHLIYGYMGIADDLDKIDFNTKKWITVKSKKDIQDLADAPVKADER